MKGGKTGGVNQVRISQESGPWALIFSTCRSPYSPEIIARIFINLLLSTIKESLSAASTP
jgi:hypothetical protein